jgi:hypothetical protein
LIRLRLIPLRLRLIRLRLIPLRLRLIRLRLIVGIHSILQ